MQAVESRHWNQSGENSAPARVFAPPRASFQCNYVLFNFLVCVYENTLCAAGALQSRACAVCDQSPSHRIRDHMRAVWQPLRTRKGLLNIFIFKNS
jgi:hypothetical protein